MKMVQMIIYLVVALIVLFYPVNAIPEHIKQETVERMGNFSPQFYMQTSVGNQEVQGDQSSQTPSAVEQYVSDQATLQGSSGQEQIGGDYQSGYQAGYANGWWAGVQATVQLLLKYLNALQDTSTALNEFDKWGISRPAGQATTEGPKIKQALDAATQKVGDLE
jgi:hypothetical protein